MNVYQNTPCANYQNCWCNYVTDFVMHHIMTRVNDKLVIRQLVYLNLLQRETCKKKENSSVILKYIPSLKLTHFRP